MVKIAGFRVEQWMDRFENTEGVLNIAETCAAPVSMDELGGFSKEKSVAPVDWSVKLTYGAIRGSSRLRERLTQLHGGPHIRPDQVIITQGAISANFLLFYSLVGPGDHVVCVYPTYQQLYSVAQSLGCDVSAWELKPEDGYVPRVSDLAGLVQPNTKVYAAWHF
jgi:aspartate/methionine/tyrosine aminotransferase